MYYFSKTRSCFEEIVQNIELQLEVHTNLHLPHESKAMPTWLPTCLYCTRSGSTKGKGTRSTRRVVPQDAMGVPDRQMMKKGQASMALEEDQIEQAMSLNHDAYPTRRALWMDERRRPIGARVRVGRNCCRNHSLFSPFSRWRAGAAIPRPAASANRQAGTGRQRRALPVVRRRRGHGARGRIATGISRAVRCCVPCEPPCRE